MKCNNTERYLLDYFIDPESYENKRELFDHLNSCSDCRKSYIQYKEMLDSSNKQDIYEETPRAELLDRVSQIAAMNSKNKTESVWRKVFHTPVLVPVFGAVMIFMLLVNVTNDGMNFINTNTQVAEKTDSASDKADNINKEVEVKKVTAQDSRKELVAHVDYSPNSDRQITISNIDSNFRSLRVSKPIFIKNVGDRLFEVESNMVANANPEIITAVLDTTPDTSEVVRIAEPELNDEINDIEDLRVDSDTAFNI